jgi:hypothetical protein
MTLIDKKPTTGRSYKKLKYGCIAVSLVLAGMVAQATWAVAARLSNDSPDHDWSQMVYLHTIRTLTEFESAPTPIGAVKVAQYLRQSHIYRSKETHVVNLHEAEDFAKDIAQMDFQAILGAPPQPQCAPKDAVVCWVDVLNTNGIAPDNSAAERMASQISNRKLTAKMARYSAVLHAHSVGEGGPYGVEFTKQHPALHDMYMVGTSIVLTAHRLFGVVS